MLSFAEDDKNFSSGVGDYVKKKLRKTSGKEHHNKDGLARRCIGCLQLAASGPNRAEAKAPHFYRQDLCRKPVKAVRILSVIGSTSGALPNNFEYPPPEAHNSPVPVINPIFSARGLVLRKREGRKGFWTTVQFNLCRKRLTVQQPVPVASTARALAQREGVSK